VLAGLPPHRILPTLDDVLVRERRSEEVFATACMLTLPPSRDSARLYLAGHPVPLLVRGDEVTTVSEVDPGPALGIVPGVNWAPDDFSLGTDGWSLLLYTDGLIEGRVGVGAERLGVPRLLHLVRASLASDRRTLPDALIEAVEKLNGGPLEDDVAALLVSYRTPSA
jgi:serine phosphatase RsbU (regulator of sigma subunit)